MGWVGSSFAGTAVGDGEQEHDGILTVAGVASVFRHAGGVPESDREDRLRPLGVCEEGLEIAG